MPTSSYIRLYYGKAVGIQLRSDLGLLETCTWSIASHFASKLAESTNSQACNRIYCFFLV